MRARVWRRVEVVPMVIRPNSSVRSSSVKRYNVSFRRHFSEPPFMIRHIAHTLFDRCLHQARVR